MNPDLHNIILNRACVCDQYYTVCSKDFLHFKFGGRGYEDQLNDSIAKTKQLAGVRVELVNSPEGKSLVWVTHNFAFLGGSLGCAEGEKITRAFEYATSQKVKISYFFSA